MTIIEQILGPDGLLVRDGGRHSAQQLDYAQRAWQGFQSGAASRTSFNCLQAETGTGKSIGYLVPLMLYAVESGARVAVSTYTRALQRQLLRADGDAVRVAGWIAELTGRRPSIARRVGMGNFVSAVACARLYDQLTLENDKANEPALELLDDLIQWLGEAHEGRSVNSGELEDFLADRGLEYLPAKVTRQSIALRTTSPDEEKRVYEAHVLASKSADVLVCNHATLMLHAYRWGAVLDDERPIKVLVCDEADRLGAAAESIIGADISLHNLQVLGSQVAQEFKVPGLAESITALHQAIMAIKPPASDAMAFERAPDIAPVLDAATHSVGVALKQIRSTLDKLNQGATLVDMPATSVGRLQEFANTATDLMTFSEALQSNNETGVISWSPVRAYPSLRLGNPNPARVLSRLWRTALMDGRAPVRPPLNSVLFTSATLATPGKPLQQAFDGFCSEVGVIRHKDAETGEPIHNVLTELFGRFAPGHFGRMRFVVTDPRAPYPTRNNEDEGVQTNPDWLDYTAAAVRAAHEQGGRTLVLSLSFADTAALAKRLSDLSPLHHRPGEALDGLLRGYREHERAILVTPAAWEGVNLPGLIQHLVISRIPFMAQDSHQQTIYRVHLQRQGFAEDKIKSLLLGRALTAARRRLAQGFGRGIRSVSDDVTAWILDPRFPKPDSFRDSLDPLLLDFRQVRQYPTMVECIPQRFREKTWPAAKIFTIDHTLYTPEVLV